MTTKKAQKPEQGMTEDEASALASIIGSHLEDAGRGSLSYLILLLRWFAYAATDDDRETVYIRTEVEFATNFAGVDEAISRELQKTLDALRKYQRQKGGRR